MLPILRLFSKEPHKQMTSYKSVKVSLIPVENRRGVYFTDPLRATDLNACVEQRLGLRLISQVEKESRLLLHQVDERVKFTDLIGLTDTDLEDIASEHDLIELPGNFGWSKSSLSRRLMKKARSKGKICIIGASSNRAKTTIVNAKSKGLVGRKEATIRATGIRQTQIYSARNVDGLRLVRNGLMPLAKSQAKEIFFETASWILKKVCELCRDYNIEKLKVSFISRLEPMKGDEIGIRVASAFILPDREVSVSVAGDNPERQKCERLADDFGSCTHSTFLGKVAHPDGLFDLVRTSDVVTLTNLNDEQPWLIFDAVSRGVFPVGPDTEAYAGLGIDERLLHGQGDPDSLRDALLRVLAVTHQKRRNLSQSLRSVLEEYTIENMHKKRDEWYKSLINKRCFGDS